MLREHKLFNTPFDPHSLFTARSQSPSPGTPAQFNVLGLVQCLAGSGTAWAEPAQVSEDLPTHFTALESDLKEEGAFWKSRTWSVRQGWWHDT